MSWRLIGWLTGIFVAALILAEVLLRPPNGDERLHLMAILGAPALVTALLVPFLGNGYRRAPALPARLCSSASAR